MSNKSASLRALFCGSVAFGALTLAMGSSWAQQTPGAASQVDQVASTEDCDPNTPGVQTGDQCPPAGQGDRVIVTGSRIARDAFTSSSPIQVITAEASVLEGLVDTAEILQGSSISSGSVQFNNTFGNFVIEGGLGINSVSLRGLGAQRSLVLLNGQRPGPAGVRGQVAAFDLNVVPESIINRVEILKDGASSIYGSDAVAGVANIITRTSVDSPEFTIQYNATEEGGGNSLQVNGAIGWDLFGGNIVLAAEYESRDPLKFGDRTNMSCAQDLIFDRTTGQRIDRIDRSVIGGTSLGNCTNLYHNTVIVGNGAVRYVPSPNGVTVGPIPGYRPRDNRNFTNSPTGFAYYEDVLNFDKFGDAYAISAVDRASLYGKADFSIFGGVDWTTEVLLNRRESEHKAWRQFFPTIAPNPLYDVPGPFPSPFTTALVQPITYFPFDSEATVDYYYVTTGLSGDLFAPGWSWQLDASYSRSDGDYGQQQILKETAGDWNFARPSDGLYAAPTYNPFDPAFLSGNYSQAVFDLLEDWSFGNTTYDQTVVTGVVTGDLWQLPAGPLGIAVGAEWRTHEINDTPDVRSQNDEFWGSTSALVTQGEDTVTEGFLEVNVPILKGVTAFEELTLDGSVRAFEYDSYGSDSVWKAGLNWQIVPSIRVRGTTGTSYRAPALYELFLGNQTGFQSQLAIDPCIDWGNDTNPNIQANCAAAGIPSNYGGVGSGALIISGGGAGVLEAETSEASTLGVIWTPDALNISLAVEYFDITIDNQVAQLGPGAILGGCYGSPVFPNGFCNLFTRNPGTHPTDPFTIATVNDSYLNVNSQSTRGIDITLRYERELNIGDLVVDLSATQTLEDVVNLFDPSIASGFATNDFNTSIGDPEWVGDATFQLRRGDFTYSWFVDYIGQTDNTVLGIAEFINYQRTPTSTINGRRIIRTDHWLSHDVSVRWRGDNFTITGGVANLFDAQPPVVSTGAAQRLQNYALGGTQYDLRGRQFFLRIGYEF